MSGQSSWEFESHPPYLLRRKGPVFQPVSHLVAEYEEDTLVIPSTARTNTRI